MRIAKKVDDKLQRGHTLENTGEVTVGYWCSRKRSVTFEICFELLALADVSKWTYTCRCSSEANWVGVVAQSGKIGGDLGNAVLTYIIRVECHLFRIAVLKKNV